MSEIDDLEAYERHPETIDSKRAAQGRKNFRKAVVTARHNQFERERREAEFDRAPRQQPSLPQFKCLSD